MALAPPTADAAGTASEGGSAAEDAARPDPARQRLVAKAERAAADADAALRAAHERVEAAAGDVTRARRERERVESKRAEVRRRLDELDAEVEAATEAEALATRGRDRAHQDEASAVDAAARLAEELQALLE